MEPIPAGELTERAARSRPYLPLCGWISLTWCVSFPSLAAAVASPTEPAVRAQLERPSGDPWGLHPAWACTSAVGTPRKRSKVLTFNQTTGKATGIRAAAIPSKRAKRVVATSRPRGWGTPFGRRRGPTALAFSGLDPEVETLLHRHIPLHLLRHDEPLSFTVHGLRLGERFAVTGFDSGRTPYGWVADAEGRWDWTPPALLGRLSLGLSDDRVYPGVRAELLSLPVGPVQLGSALALWTQPEALRRGARPTPGGSLELRPLYPWDDHITLWWGGHGKTAGWEHGLVERHGAFVYRLGLTGWFGDPSRSPY